MRTWSSSRCTLLLAALIVSSACSGDDNTSAGSEGATATSETSEATSAGVTSDGSATSAGTDTGDTDTGTDSSATDTDAPAAACQQDRDCQLVDDCCTCGVIGQSDEPPKCDAPECLATVCTAEGIVPASATCRLGHCHFGALACSGPVDCAQAPPDCPAGELPSIVGGCWGACVPARLCDEVPSCDGAPCGPGWFCVETQSGAPARCHPTPEGCAGELSCGCLFSYLPEFCQASCADLNANTVLCEDGG